MSKLTKFIGVSKEIEIRGEQLKLFPLTVNDMIIVERIEELAKKSQDKSATKEETSEMVSVCKYLRSELVKGFDDLKALKDSGNITEADLDYELARDRKSGLALKSLMVEMAVDKMSSRRITHITE